MNKSERTRRYIIEKSAPVFNKKGIAGTSLADLTAATGLSKGSIYGNFRSKDDLAVAVFQYNTTNLTGYFERRLRRSRNAIEKLMAYPEAFRELYRSMLAYGGCPIVNTAAEADDTHERLCRLTAEFITGWRQTLMELVQAAQAEGDIRKDADAGETADIIISLFEGAGLLSKTTGQDHFITHAIRQIESLIHGLAAGEPSRAEKIQTAGKTRKAGKTIAIGRSIDVTQHVARFDEACEMLENSRPIVIAECACRRETPASGSCAQIPREVCFMFGAMARYYLDHQMGREVGLEEALAILKRAHEAGLVIQPATARNPGGMCSCHIDWCDVLSALKSQPRPADQVSASCTAHVDALLCTGCGACLERCQMAAIEINTDNRAFVRPERCIGCGLCAPVCPTGAMALEPRGDKS